MTASPTDRLFAGSIPQVYDEVLVPLIFAPYAADLAARLAGRDLGRVLEVAAGTGVVTRELARTLPPGAELVATDLNAAMLDQARASPIARPVRWEPADAQQLPYPDASFDAVVCQFGVMFFPDRAKAFAEVRRVLRPGGVFLFNVWDRIEDNEFAATVTDALARLFPQDPPRFLARTPHGHHDIDAMKGELGRGGFAGVTGAETVTASSRAASPRVPAVAYCQGTPLRAEIEAQGPGQLVRATDAATEALALRFGRGPIAAKIQAHVWAVSRQEAGS